MRGPWSPAPGIVFAGALSADGTVVPRDSFDEKLSGKSCTASEAGSGKFAVHSVAGRWEVRIAVYEIPVNDEATDAVFQILEDLGGSKKAA